MPAEEGVDGPPLRFRFGPRDRRGLVAGVRAGQLVPLAGSLPLAALLARRPGGLPLAALVLLVGVALGWLPLAGRTAEEWLPLCARHGALRLRGWLRPSPSPRSSPAARPVPSLFAGLALVELPNGGGAAVHDGRSGTLSAALAVRGGSFALLDEVEREHRVGAWAAVLAAAARQSGSLHRLQWVERTVPAGALAEPSQGALPGWPPARDSYAALLRSERGGLRHELLLSCTVRTTRRARPLPGGTPSQVPATSLRLLAGELASLARRCGDAGIAVEGPLSHGELVAALRRACEVEPVVPAGPAPWPSRCEVAWSSLRTGPLWHASYWVAEWPRHEVPSDFLLPLLLEAEERRTVSLVMRPLPPVRAARAAEHARTSKAADAELRRRHGFALTARSRREQEAVARREGELAEGHAGYRFSGYVTASAASPEELAAACRRLEQSASLARLELRRLDGDQGAAFTCTLPLGRGCR